MILKMFTVFDSKAAAYLPPFFTQTTGTALRSFESECNNPESSFYKYPGDYALFELGSFDQANSTVELLPAPLNLGLAQEFINQTPITPIQRTESK